MEDAPITDTDAPLDADNQVSSPNTNTGRQKRKAPRTAFAAGYDPRRNLAGRPKKGESVPELLRRTIERPRVSQAVVQATVERLMRTDAVGNRAFADVRDTVYGVPKQTLQLEQADSPLLAFLERRQQRLTVEGESRELEPGDE